jgi:hypothetical protein
LLDAAGFLIHKYSQTCYFYRDRLSKLPESQYIVLLYRCGMEDGPNRTLTVCERLEALRTYARDRFDLRYFTHDFSFPDGDSGPRIARGVVWSCEKDKVNVYRLRCPQRGVEPKYWAVPIEDGVKDTMVNSSMDLLLTVRLGE